MINVLEEIGNAWRQIPNTDDYNRLNMPRYGAEYETPRKTDEWNTVNWIHKYKEIDEETNKIKDVTEWKQFQATYQPGEALTIWNFVQQGTTHPYENPPKTKMEETILNETCILGQNGFMAIQIRDRDTQPWHVDAEKISHHLKVSIGFAVKIKTVLERLSLKPEMVRRILWGSTSEDGSRKEGLVALDGSTPSGLIQINKIIEYLEVIAHWLDEEGTPEEDALNHQELHEGVEEDDEEEFRNGLSVFEMKHLSDRRDGVKHEFLSRIEHGDWDHIKKTQSEMFWKYKGLTQRQKSQIWETIKYRKEQLRQQGQ